MVFSVSNKFLALPSRLGFGYLERGGLMVKISLKLASFAGLILRFVCQLAIWQKT
jgi:hypothetical protein